MTRPSLPRFALASALVLAAPLTTLLGGEASVVRAHSSREARVYVAPPRVVVGFAYAGPVFPGPPMIGLVHGRPEYAAYDRSHRGCRHHPSSVGHALHDLRKSIHRRVRSHVRGVHERVHGVHDRVHRAIFH